MFAENLTRKLLRDHIISADDYDIVRYGLENIGSTLAGMITTAFACFLYKEWSIQTYLFIIAVFL